MQRFLCMALVVLSIFTLALPCLVAQVASQPKIAAPEPSPLQLIERDLKTRKEALLRESTDLEEMMKALRGSEMDAALSVDQKTTHGIMELDATIWFLAIYENMQCEADREVAKTALKNRLGFYSYLLGLEADQVAAQLAYTRLPATAQAAQRIKEDLRGAKNKLDEVAESLK